ncbi:MarR family transcriptional regulator, partial [Rhizobium johnstonii]|uniref:MarR family transcriptional regulator n=1 Tax=Rhizobium johnstonii TaxID=3019933 RepID=UPI003F9E6105
AAIDEADYGDIRPPQANVFTFARPEGIQFSELTKLARVRKQTMTQAVEELERLVYVERRPAAIAIGLTPWPFSVRNTSR